MSGIKFISIHFILVFSFFLLSGCEKSTYDIHMEAFVADAHNDILLRAIKGEDILSYHAESHSDIEKFKQGGVDLQVFSIEVSPFDDQKRFFQNANDMINKLNFLVTRVPDRWNIAKSYQDIMYNNRKNKMSCVIGVEGGHVIGDDIEKLDLLYENGMRYLGLTWENSNKLASSARDEYTKGESLPFIGLTDFGKQVVRRCNEIGVVIDVSNIGELAFWDVVNTSNDPIIASHSSVYKLCPHYRNLKDSQIKAIAKTGGAVFINFYPGYIDSTFFGKANIVNMRYDNELDMLASKYDTLSNEFWYKKMKLLKYEKARIAPSINDVVKHIGYVVDLVGIDHVGIGSDYDGVEIMPTGLENVTKLPFLTKKLIEHGYTIREVRKILGDNFKRIFKEVCK